MGDPYDTGSPVVNRMCRLQFTGNVIPVAWYRTIRKETGKPNLNAIIILADIVYWYRPVELRDEATGQLRGFQKKFRADLLQRSYQQIADQFGLSKRDATRAVVELEKLGVVRRVFRTVSKGGQQTSNVLFLALDVDRLLELTYPEKEENCEAGAVCGGSRQNWREVPPEPEGAPAGTGGRVPPEMEGGAARISGRHPPESEGGNAENGETYTENTCRDYGRDFSIRSYRFLEERIKRQIGYEALKLDHPCDDRIDEILGLILDVQTSSAHTIRVNREEKPVEVVKAQFAKLNQFHVEFVLQNMDGSSTKARNIRALLLTALYNAVLTISSYYGNLYQYHQSQVQEKTGEEEGNDF